MRQSVAAAAPMPQRCVPWRRLSPALRAWAPSKAVGSTAAPARCSCFCSSSPSLPSGTDPEHAVVAELRRALQQHAMVPPGGALVACCSGGVDSTAMLLALAQLAPDLALSLHVLHFNHAIRPQSVAEADVVRDLAARLGLPFHLQVAEEWPSSGVPAAARAWRRKHALSLAASLPGPARVATAHTADDQRETLLLKLLRGVHVSRLSGMAPRAGSFVRPLLGCSKAQLVEYVGTQGVGWCEDASNEDPGYSRRNAVRLRLVPLLQQLSGGALDARLQDAVHQSAAVRGWLDAAPKVWAGAAGGAPMEEEEEEEEEAAPFLDDDREAHAARGDAPCEPGELDILSWLRLPALARLDQLHGFLVSSTGGAVAYATLRKLADLAAAPTARPRWRAHLSDKHTLLRCGRRLRVVARGGGGDGGPDADEGDAAAVTTTCCGDVAVTHPRSWRVRMHPLELPSSQHAGGGVAPPAGEDAWGSDALCGGQTLHLPLGGAPLLLRTRRDGDRFAPHWRPKALKLRDFLRDLKVPLHVRDTLPLLLDANRGTVLAVYPAWAAREVALPGEGRRSVRLVVQQHRVGA